MVLPLWTAHDRDHQAGDRVAGTGQTDRSTSVVSTERVVAVSAYTVQAVKWEHGWELHVQDVGVTQCRTLATATQQTRDFVATMFDIDADDAEIHLSVAIGGVEKDVERARKMTAEAIDKQHQAATESRRVARELRHAGLSVADTAAVMDISKGRVSQLISQ